MTPETTHDDEYVRQLVDLAAGWFSERRDQDKIFVIDARGRIYRSTEARRIRNPILPQHLEEDGQFCQISSVAQLAQQLLYSLLNSRRQAEWTPVKCSLAISRAASLLDRICSELGTTPDFAMDRNAIPRDLERQSAKDQDFINREQQIEIAFVRNIQAAFCKAAHQGSSGNIKDPPGLLVIGHLAGTAHVLEVDGSGHIMDSHLFSNFFQSIVAAEQTRLASLKNSITKIMPERRQHAREMLGNISRTLAKAMDIASFTGRSVMLRAAVGKVNHGVPISIWIAIDDSTTRAESGYYCTLLVHRAHREFILGASTGSLLYFPPCQLVSAVQFNDGDPTLAFPKVRQPAGAFGHTWLHPYTGKLNRKPTPQPVGASVEDPAFYKPSPQAIRLFSRLGNRSDTPYIGDLCLSGQDTAVMSLRARFNAAISGNGGDKLINIITAIHDIARIGLTRAHEQNTATPRARLSSEAMPFPLKEATVTGILARRIFPYYASRLPGSRAPF